MPNIASIQFATYCSLYTVPGQAWLKYRALAPAGTAVWLRVYVGVHRALCKVIHKL